MATVDEIAVQIVARVEGLVAGIEQATHSIEGFRASVEGMAGAFTEFAEVAGIAFAVEKLAEFAKEMAEVGEEMEHTATLVGMPLQKFAELTAVMTAAVGSAEGARVSIQRLGVNMEMAIEQPTSRAALAFQRLGIISSSDQHARREDEFGYRRISCRHRSAGQPARALNAGVTSRGR